MKSSIKVSQSFRYRGIIQPRFSLFFTFFRRDYYKFVRTFSNTHCRTAAQQQPLVEQQLNGSPLSNNSSTAPPCQTAAQRDITRSYPPYYCVNSAFKTAWEPTS
ncbi:hypothetical protein AXF42_Ash019199 [Apostasia shenzhenica]|uniref:Uncharacterized protein n=1 Tax=Apostasia shenzhenica TaxID=1088818 RepID=A0A2I0B2H4_9ASPA|nr:hypothetical protein AXF42_Ash019199 [Apostasia shenzhenica]